MPMPGSAWSRNQEARERRQMERRSTKTANTNTANALNNNTIFPFFKLPAELCNEVYGHTFEPMPSLVDAIPALLVIRNRILRKEAYPVFHNRTFIADFSPNKTVRTGLNPDKKLLQTLKNPNLIDNHFKHIKGLQIVWFHDVYGLERMSVHDSALNVLGKALVKAGFGNDRIEVSFKPLRPPGESGRRDGGLIGSLGHDKDREAAKAAKAAKMAERMAERKLRAVVRAYEKDEEVADLDGATEDSEESEDEDQEDDQDED